MSIELEELPPKLGAVEFHLAQAIEHVERGGPRSRQSWSALGRAASKARTVQRGIAELRVPPPGKRSGEPVLYTERRPRLKAALSETVQLWSDVKAFVRYSPRSDNAAENAPHTLIRMRDIRRSVTSERRWVQTFVAPPRVKGRNGARGGGTARNFETASGDRAASAGPIAQTPHEPFAVIPRSSFADENPSANSLVIRTERDYLQTRNYQVWFGTNRAYLEEGRFADHAGGDLVVGSCSVHVPKTHAFGSLGSSWIRRAINWIFAGRGDDRLRVQSINVLSPERFVAAIDGELSAWPVRSALLVIHGYNVDFDEAARRTAQIGFDLRVDGISAFFSWPSLGRILPYTSDEESVQEAELRFIEFVQLLCSAQGIDEVNILAHSMGNRLLLRSVKDLLAIKEDKRLPVPVGQIILAAADVSCALFSQYIDTYRALARKRLTSYSCTRDLPLMISSGVHGRSRVGLEPPVFVTRHLHSISAGDLDLHGLGHGYYAETEALLYDIADLLHANTHPNDRIRLEPGPESAGAHWVFKR